MLPRLTLCKVCVECKFVSSLYECRVGSSTLCKKRKLLNINKFGKIKIGRWVRTEEFYSFLMMLVRFSKSFRECSLELEVPEEKIVKHLAMEALV